MWLWFSIHHSQNYFDFKSPVFRWFDKVKNECEIVKWENVRTFEIINHKEKDDAWRVRKYKKLKKIRDNKW